MTKGSLLTLALAVGSLAACAHQENRPAAASSAATYYGPSAASWAPEVGAWQPPRRAPATTGAATRGP
jgi:hypothetical protein